MEPARVTRGFGREERGRTIMLVHGMWSRPHVWNGFRGFFEDRGYQVVTPTLRHHDIEPGMAADPALATTSLLDYAADLERHVLTLDEKPYIIGHSMGGLLTQMLAARGLARAAALLASTHCAPVFAFDLAVARIFRREFTGRFWRRHQLPSYASMRWGALNGFGEEEASDLYRTLIPESGRSLLEIAFWYLDRNRASFVDRHSVTCPLLFITGTEDRLTPPDFAWSTVDYYGPKARIEFLRNRGHWLPSEPGWEETAAKIARFFEIEAPLFRLEPSAAIAARPAIALQTI